MFKICNDAGLDELQGEIKTARRNINNLKYADDISLMAESEEELTSLFRKLKRETEKAGLKLSVHKLILWHMSHYFMPDKWG